MRGAPFGFSNFGRGLNVQDSPYNLQNGESRDCLNVVSTPRGSIRKRYGSIGLLHGGLIDTTLAPKDTFERANENPLSNAGKWSLLKGAGVSAIGQIKETAYWSNGVGGTQGARWNVSEFLKPYATIKLGAKSGEPTKIVESSLYVCWKEVGEEGKGYYLRAHQEVATKNALELVRKDGTENSTGLWSSGNVLEMAPGDSIGITVRGEYVVAWRKPSAGSWERVAEVKDATYTQGYSGVTVFAGTVTQFATGESVATTEAEFNSLAPVYISGVPYLLGVSEGKLYSINAANEATVIRAVNITPGKRWSIVQAPKGTRLVQGPVYLSNGIDAPIYWTGATKATEALPWTAAPEGEFIEVPKAKYLLFFANRIWAAGITADTSALRFTGFASTAGEGEKADPTSWPKENFVYFDKEDGYDITGIGVAGASLLVFKQHKTWVVYNLDEGENRRLSDSVGCVSHRSIVETPEGTFFLTPDQGVFSTNGSSVREVSRNVRPILQGTDSNEARAAKLNTLENAAAGYLNGHYYLSYTAKDGTQKTLDYDIALTSWWLHDLAGNQWALWEPTAGAPSLYTIPSKTGAGVVKAWVPTTYQDSGANYTGAKSLTAYWASPWEPFFQYVLRHRINQPQTKKRIRQLFLDGKGEVIAFQYKTFAAASETLKGVVDNADASKPESPVKLGTSEKEVQAVRYYSLGIARVWGFGFGNNSSEPFEINTYATDVQFRKS